jgi:hypothetical protein
VKSDFWSETSTTTSQKLSGMVYEASLTMGITTGVDGMVGISESDVAGTTTNTMVGISIDVTDSIDLIFRSSHSQVNIKSLGLRYSF